MQTELRYYQRKTVSLSATEVEIALRNYIIDGDIMLGGYEVRDVTVGPEGGVDVEFELEITDPHAAGKRADHTHTVPNKPHRRETCHDPQCPDHSNVVHPNKLTVCSCGQEFYTAVLGGHEKCLQCRGVELPKTPPNPDDGHGAADEFGGSDYP